MKYYRFAQLLSLVAISTWLSGCNDASPGSGGALEKSGPRDFSVPKEPDLSVTPVLEQPQPQPRTPEQTKHSLFVRSSRCGECHEKMRIEWLESAHAKASHHAGYRRALATAPDAVRVLCESCHLPSRAYGQPDEEPNRPSEGVSCDGCHTLSAVQVSKTSTTMTFDPSSGKKYGPIVGASGHYFHDMAYSVLHTKSEMCAGCHHMTAFTVGSTTHEIPVVTDYSDWQRLGKGEQCQDCHMPSRGTEAVARGSKPRANVPSHLFPSSAALSKLIKFELSPKSKPGELSIDIQHNAGHMMPSGYVDRRLLVRAEFFGADGAKLATEDRAYGIFLADESGQPAPFWKASKVKEDRRMTPGKQYIETFKIPQAGASAAGKPTIAAAPVRVTISLLAAPTAPELSATYGEPELSVLKSSSHNLPLRPGGK